MKEIKTYNTKAFIDQFMKPDQKVKAFIRQDFGQFFIMPVEDLIIVSQVPVPPSRSSNHIIIFLTDGIATMKIGHHLVEIVKDECLIVPATQVFCYEKYEVNKGFICVFNDEFLVSNGASREQPSNFEFLTVWGNPVIQPDADTATFLRGTFQRLLTEYARNELKHPALLQAYLVAALNDLNTCYKPLSLSKNDAAVNLTNRFKALLHQHIRHKHLVTDYASLLHVTPNHLTKTVRQITQKPVSKWIDETLVTEAKILLLQTRYSIQQVASELGIDDASYFSRLFKKYEHVSPLQYRRMIEKS